jgi:cellulose synthase/poly-beta-1,6-N-acetylglucosamine synthase-like glycosyltransferase
MSVVAWVAGAPLVAFGLHRYVCWVNSLLTPRAFAPARDRTVAVLVAARNEERLLPRLLDALDHMDYPRELLEVVLVSDGSTDATVQLMEGWSRDRPSARTVVLPERAGKGAALARGMEAAPNAELVAVMDADTEPQPDALARLVGAFDDAHVGAVCGYPRPGNASCGFVSRYAAMERWVYHLITLAGKDRLDWNPPVAGALFAVRRKALEEAGGFPAGDAEDVKLTMALTGCGWRTRWTGLAVAREDVPANLRDFVRQRVRWSRGLLASGRRAGTIEDVFVAAGYLDRLVALVALMLVVGGWMPLWLPFLYALAPGVAIVTALLRSGEKNKTLFLVALVPMMFVDVGVTLVTAVAHVARTPIGWTERSVARPEA